MLRSQPHLRRSGVTALESAIVLPVLFGLLLIIVVGGYGVFRYQQIAMLAREGARYACVHGAQYQSETGNTAATSTDVYNNAILPYATNLDLTQLTYTVTWNSSNSPYTSSSTDYEKALGNTVQVTVTYQWFPEYYLVGPYTLTSTSIMPMAY
jgi:Flp pilus assembly protein TadG